MALFVMSCSNNSPIYYKSQDITITRLDKINGEAETHFFYGYYDGKSRPYPKSFIKVTYHGFDASMSGYLIFLLNNKVQVVKGSGSFEKIGNDSTLIIKQFMVNGSFDNGLYIKWYDSIKGNYRNVVYFQDVDTTGEKANNIRNHSDVKAVYVGSLSIKQEYKPAPTTK